MPGGVRRRYVDALVHEPGAELRRQRVRGRRHLDLQRPRLPDQAAEHVDECVSLTGPERRADAAAVSFSKSSADASSVARAVATAERGADASSDGKADKRASFGVAECEAAQPPSASAAQPSSGKCVFPVSCFLRADLWRG